MTSTTRRMTEMMGPEALWLLRGTTGGRLVFVQRGLTQVRPAVHVLENGRLIVRVPAPEGALAGPAVVTYNAEEIDAARRSGWSISVTGPVGLIVDVNEAAHYRRTLPGWVFGPHDTLAHISPQTVRGYRLAAATAAAAEIAGSGRSNGS
ncbi:pyridoxamine 5'-phosphate oxidase family protein [Streptomyces sp. RKAG293]|uniref:pyridoxamine 5'-phosphate oxidase family protein n=1 Tax=Streptomyces sp. RKAG293 TaxID=2893403 RepID=UPI0020338BD9|nr:pyridoxamine 5'-phosphate oxidase family protein [Streptomyces sp. RKAG293]MCM2422737.1 pyridoxamine 5'-phosphate oxidase family protein [Streptomyces sp. RKAG293]